MPFIIMGGGFILLDMILSALLNKKDVLGTVIDDFYEKITGKSTLLAMFIPIGAMVGSFGFGILLYPVAPAIGITFIVISYILFGHFASHRFR